MMPLLHLVAFSPAREDQLELLARACNDGDTIVLLEAGSAFADGGQLPALRRQLPDCRLVLLDDKLTRATAHGEDALTIIDYHGLVALTESHRGPASWY